MNHEKLIGTRTKPKISSNNILTSSKKSCMNSWWDYGLEDNIGNNNDNDIDVMAGWCGVLSFLFFFRTRKQAYRMLKDVVYILWVL